MPVATEIQKPGLGKEQVIHNVPKAIKELSFGVLSDQDIINQSQVEVVDRRMFEVPPQTGRRTLCEYGPLDRRMGISGKRDSCATCGEPLQTCNGHFGHVKLVLPVFHVGYFKKVIQILQSICKARYLFTFQSQTFQLTFPGLFLHPTLRNRSTKIHRCPSSCWR